MQMDQSSHCCRKSHQMQHLMDVCLLVLLSQKISHGYLMLEELKRFGFSADQLSTSTLYRSLRNLEAGGAVTSDWEAGGPGPQRRVYQITTQGSQILAAWIQILGERRARINSIIEEYSRLV
jgi:PadR family transcriptional regulator, regulatory protein PadR